MVVFLEEDKYTLHGAFSRFTGVEDHGMRTYPKSGAVLIVEPSTHGHIHSFCRELRLTCVYPNTKSENHRFSLIDLLERLEDEDITIRHVSDGYTARLYEVETKK